MAMFLIFKIDEITMCKPLDVSSAADLFMDKLALVTDGLNIKNEFSSIRVSYSWMDNGS